MQGLYNFLYKCSWDHIGTQLLITVFNIGRITVCNRNPELWAPGPRRDDANDMEDGGESAMYVFKQCILYICPANLQQC